MRSSQIKPISYLKANAAEVLDRLADRREPMLITQNGEAKAAPDQEPADEKPDPPKPLDAHQADVGDPANVVITPGDFAPKPAEIQINGQTYREAYASIPFNRAEYNANPNYRHDAAMELLFQKMRQTVIHRHAARPQIAQPAVPYNLFPLRHGQTYGSWFGWGTPYWQGRR